MSVAQAVCLFRAAMSFKQEYHVFIVVSYCESKSYLKCQEQFLNAFPDANVPNKYTICRLFKRLLKVAYNVRKRVDACFENHGGHFQHLL